MKFKKLFASVLAIALAVTAIPATSAKADVIEGSAAFLNTEVYKTVLPTTASQKFYLDPQGLSQVGKTGQAALPTGSAGQIVGKSTMAAINLSSRPVKMSVSYVLDVDAADMDVVSLANSGTAITNAADTVTKPAVCLTVKASVTSPAKAVTGASVLAAANTKSAFTATPYEFEAADYEAVTKAAFDANDLDELYNADNYEYKMVNQGASIELQIGGICLAQGDYSAFTGANAKSLNLDMTFKFTKDDGSDVGPDLASAIDTGIAVRYDNATKVSFISYAGVETSSINYFIDGVLSTNSSLIYNDGTSIGMYGDSLYTPTNHCIMTFEYGGTLYKQTMW